MSDEDNTYFFRNAFYAIMELKKERGETDKNIKHKY